METAPSIKFSPAVILIDINYLNFVIQDMRHHFTAKLGRPLEKVDLPYFIENVALDGGLREKEVQVLMVYDKHSPYLAETQPNNILKDLDGKAFQSELAEFSFLGVPSEDLITPDALFRNIFSLAVNSKEVKRIIGLCDIEAMHLDVEQDIREYLATDEATQKEIVFLSMVHPEKTDYYRQDILMYALLNAIGISSEDLK